MKNKTIGFLALVTCASAISINAAASDLLWESYEFGAGGSWGGSVPTVVTTTIGMQFYLGYVSNTLPGYPVSYAGGTYTHIDEQALSHLIGGNAYFSKGDSGIFDFDAYNSPAFAEVSSRLTNGLNEIVKLGGFGYNADQIMTGGKGIGGLEDQQWNNLWIAPSQQQLIGANIDRYRLTVSNVSWGTDGTRYTVLGTAMWQVYGTLAPIPEPSVYAMMLTGLGLLSFARRQKRESNQR